MDGEQTLPSDTEQQLCEQFARVMIAADASAHNGPEFVTRHSATRSHPAAVAAAVRLLLASDRRRGKATLAKPNQPPPSASGIQFSAKCVWHQKNGGGFVARMADLVRLPDSYLMTQSARLRTPDAHAEAHPAHALLLLATGKLSSLPITHKRSTKELARPSRSARLIGRPFSRNSSRCVAQTAAGSAHTPAVTLMAAKAGLKPLGPAELRCPIGRAKPRRSPSNMPGPEQ
jgi:hypothetical protein